MTRSARIAFGLAVLGLTAWVNACDDPSSPGDDGGEAPSLEPTISEPLAGASALIGGVGGGGRILRSTIAGAGAEDSVAYIAVPPDSQRTADIAVIHNPAHEGSITVAVRDGGFDPVPVVASPGDIVNVQFLRLGGADAGSLAMRVPSKTAPKVVRSNPPRGRQDVPINKHIVVVFSEPIEPASLTTSTLRVRRGGTTVPGTVRLIDGSGFTAAFVPNAPLAARAEYTVNVAGVRDIQGDPFVGTVTLGFRTGTTRTGPPATIRMSVDTLMLSARTYQLSAIVEDAAGNILADRTVVWSANHPAGLSVSQTGLITAHAEGEYSVFARVGDVVSRTDVTYTSSEAPHTMTLEPSTATVIAEDSIFLTAALFDASGNRLVYRDLTWTTSDPALGTPSFVYDNASHWRANVIAQAAGEVTITVASGMASATSRLTITPPRPVASVTLVPGSVDLIVNGTVRLVPTLRTADGSFIKSRPIVWSTTDPAVATVEATTSSCSVTICGLVTAVRLGTAGIIATSEGVSDTVPVTVAALSPFTSIMVTRFGSCGLDAGGKAWCWGALGFSVAAFRPMSVDTHIRFASLSGGLFHMCGLTANGIAFCWGMNESGQVGNGSTSYSVTSPSAVTGGLTFVSLTAGHGHTCGLTAAGVAYCWGSNAEGQLGSGAAGADRLVPTRVSGPLVFASLSAGNGATCGITRTGAGYCWGSNAAGQLGNGSTVSFTVAPVAISGGHTFASISVGGNLNGSFGDFACGVTTAGAAYCWGAFMSIVNRVPVAVGGGISFSEVHAGSFHACGLDRGGAAFCWGSAESGKLGNGVVGGAPFSPVPVAVSGGLVFSQLAVSAEHACALTTGQVTYCWGRGSMRQLGNGTESNSNVPVKVVGQP